MDFLPFLFFPSQEIMNDFAVITITPSDAWQMLQGGPKGVLIDVRSVMEYLFVGHPKGAIHVPWIDEPDWDINPNFVAEVRKEVSCIFSNDEKIETIPILLICRCGNRSLEAGKVLIKEGFSNVYNIVEGFEGPLDAQHHRSTLGGWRFHGLPWEQC